MALHIPGIRMIRLFVRFMIPSADFIMNSRVWANDINANRLFSGKPKGIWTSGSKPDWCNRLDMPPMDESMNQEVPLHIAGEITIVRKSRSLICKSEYTSVTAD